MKMIRLKSVVTDVATKLTGMVTHMRVGPAAAAGMAEPWYCFQPRGIDTEKGTPMDHMWVEASRLKAKPADIVEAPPLPVEILGTPVVDEASGFKGTATGLVLHMQNCLHVEIQAAGTNSKGKTIPLQEMDIRRLTGPKVPKATEREKVLSEKHRPSPIEAPVGVYR